MSETTKDAKRRKTVARHGNLSSPSVGGQIARFVAVALAVVLVSGVGVIGYTTYTAVADFSASAVELEGQESVPPDIGEIEGGVNLFVAGTDACEPDYAAYFGDRCTGADAGGELNDVNMLIHISDEPRRVTVISFPRDLMIPIPECTDPDTGRTTSAMTKQPLNSTFSYGGLSCAVKTISELTGQNIPFAAAVTWGGVIEITNAVGGVEVCIANGIKDPYTGIDWPEGNKSLVGLEALQFLRTRHGDEIVFISYPVNGDPADPDKVVPNYTAADSLWAALETNRPLQLTGKSGQGDGVIVETPAPTDPAEPTEAATPGTPVDPSEEAIALPPAVTGQTAAQETCSNGNVR